MLASTLFEIVVTKDAPHFEFVLALMLTTLEDPLSKCLQSHKSGQQICKTSDEKSAGTFQVLGGVDGNAQDIIGSAGFTVHVQQPATVPAPSSAVLLSGGLMLLMVARQLMARPGKVNPVINMRRA